MITNPKLAVTGRVKLYLEKPELGTLPISCRMIKPNFSSNSDILDLIEYISKSLRTAAGLNIHLDNFQEMAESVNPEARVIRVDSDADIVVSDSMEEWNKSWKTEQPNVVLLPIDLAIFEAYLYGLSGSSLSVDLSHLRPKDHRNDKGMVSSGAESFFNLIEAAFNYGRDGTLESFLVFLQSFNQEIRRGGIYKNGALTVSIPCWHPLAKHYMEIDPATHPWVKKGLVIPSDYPNFGLNDLICEKVNQGHLWLEKAVIQEEGGKKRWLRSDDRDIPNRLLSNVCREVLSVSGGTCNLTHVNLGMCSISDIPKAFQDGMTFLCDLHSRNPQEGVFETVEGDKQVGLGVLGLANFLTQNDIAYEDFTNTLTRALDAVGYAIRLYVNPHMVFNEHVFIERYQAILQPTKETPDTATQAVVALIAGYILASREAYRNNMLRAFVIAPTATSSYNHSDLFGFTTCPEISPPILSEVERVSETNGSQIYLYPDSVELACNVGFKTYFNLANQFQRLMDLTGLGHSISFNVWEDIDPEWLEKFADSYLLTTYYRLVVDNPDFLDKSAFLENELACECGG